MGAPGACRRERFATVRYPTLLLTEGRIGLREPAVPNNSFFPQRYSNPAAIDPAERNTATVRTNTGSAPQHANRVLASLPERDFALVAAHLHVVSVPAGAVLQHQDDPVEYLYFPHDGLVSLLAMTPEGQSMKAASIGRGGAKCPILDTDAENLFSAVSLAPLHVSRLAATQLQALQRESDAFCQALSACREALLFQFRQNIVCSGLHSVEHRLPRWLLETADRLEAMLIPVTQDEVAQRLGVRRTTVTLLASSLQDAGTIRWGRSRVEILDRARLEVMACGCYVALRERTSALLPSNATNLRRCGAASTIPVTRGQ